VLVAPPSEWRFGGAAIRGQRPAVKVIRAARKFRAAIFSLLAHFDRSASRYRGRNRGTTDIDQNGQNDVVDPLRHFGIIN
jgi:hypothetical protein